MAGKWKGFKVPSTMSQIVRIADIFTWKLWFCVELENVDFNSFLERLIGEGKNISVIEERQTTNGEKVRQSRLRTFLLFLVNNHTDMKFPKSIEAKKKQKQKRDFYERDQRNNDMLRFKFSQRSSSEISWGKKAERSYRPN